MTSTETRKFGNAVLGLYKAIFGLKEIEHAADKRIQDIISGSVFTSLTSYPHNRVTVSRVQTDLTERKTKYIEKHNVVEKAAALEEYRGRVGGTAETLKKLYSLTPDLEKRVEEYMASKT